MTTTTPERIGRYEIERELGRGAMGVVYEAADPLLGRKVALKTIRLGFTVAADERAQFEQRFFSEARAAARLQHPAIVVVHDVGQDPATGDLFIALEHLRGRTLTDVVAEGGALPWRDALRVVQRLATALHHAHENGIVHRDVKPDNVMLLDSGEPKLMDFGIAKVETVQLTVAGQVFGTPRYMSPEQALGKPADARSDLFALGSLAYFLLTGHHAFGAPTIPLVIAQVAKEDPPAPARLAAPLPADVERVLWRMLAKRREDRYPDGRSIAEDVDDVLADRPPRHAAGVVPAWKETDDDLLAELLADDVRPGGTEADVPEAVATRVSAPPVATTKPPAHAGLIVAAVAILVVVAGGLLWPRTPAPAARPATAPAATEGRTAAAPAREPAAAEDPAEAPLASGSARVRFQLQHSLRRGQVEVSVDGDVVFEDDLEGRTSRKLRFIKTSKGRLETNIDVPAGERVIRVEVRWDDEVKARTVRATLEAGETRYLDAELAGLIRRNLALSLN